MKITITDTKNSKSILTLPVMPQEVEYSSSSRFQEYEILDLGKVSLPRGRNLSSLKWEGLFPAYSRKEMTLFEGIEDPKNYVKKIESWRLNRRKLSIRIEGTLLENETMYINEFTYSMNSIGDYKYTISFLQAESISMKKTKRKSSKSKKYKVKRNDETLREISKKYYGDGSMYRVIYKANKKLIDKENAEQKKKKKKVSQYKIYKGQVLTIPALSTSEKKKVSILMLQKAINKDKYAKIKETGKLSASTKNAIKKIKIKSGKRGEVVKFVQRKVGADKDGICGPKTVKKIKAYQRKNHLKVDGVAGEKTLMKMVS